jgi:hypothetical protein
MCNTESLSEVNEARLKFELDPTLSIYALRSSSRFKFSFW